jgi:hypothetical protein
MGKNGMTRRSFLRGVTGIAVSPLLVNALPFTPIEVAAQSSQCTIDPTLLLDRANRSYELREAAALLERESGIIEQFCNGDEATFPNASANFTKTLRHNEFGEVRLDHYGALLLALSTGEPADFEAIPMRGILKLADPQAAYAFELEGPDSHQMDMAPAPGFVTAETAGEMVELYWQAITRDIPFGDYSNNPLIAQAGSELSQLLDFRGPKVNRIVDSQTIFRGSSTGDLVGPLLSQFLWQSVPYGAITFEQKVRVPIAGDDHMIAYEDWLSVQNGTVVSELNYDGTPRYIRNYRDMGEYVHQDISFQSYLSAAYILLGMGAPFDSGNPYLYSNSQESFVTFGDPHLFYLIGSIATRALKCAWFHKWLVHRRLRPEAMGARIHSTNIGLTPYLVHNDVLLSEAVGYVFEQNGTYLLPQAYPEGSPTHPSYPAGHAVVAGACVSVLKAFFDEDFVIQEPVISSPDGLSLLPLESQELTVGGELTKLASNMAFGRNAAGVHFRSDGVEGLKLGESIAVSVLNELRSTYNENFEGFTLTKFDGTRIVI